MGTAFMNDPGGTGSSTRRGCWRSDSGTVDSSAWMTAGG